MEPPPVVKRQASMQELLRERLQHTQHRSMLAQGGSTRASIGRDDDEWAFSSLPQNALQQEESDHYYDAKHKKWRRSSKVSPSLLVQDFTPRRLNEKQRWCFDTIVQSYKRLIRGVDQAENPMVKRARTEERFPRRTWRFNPRGVCLSAWSVSMIPPLCYVALVTPFEIAFVRTNITLFYVNLMVDIYFVVDLLVNFNLAFYDRERDRWVLKLYPIAIQYVRGWFFLDLVSCFPFETVVTLSNGGTLLSIFLYDANDERGLFVTRIAKLLRLPRLLRMMRFGRVVSRLASKINVSFKLTTMIKYTALLLVTTHFFACLIRLVGSSCPEYTGNRQRSSQLYEYDALPISDGTYLEMEGDPKCWLATVRFQRRGMWYEYVAALSWAAKAFGGEADAITFGEHLLGAAIMLCGMVMTALLIGEIANVLTNFDPALNAYRTSMDNLNQYITERNITKSLQRHLREYYINSEGLFRKIYHREMLQSLSPALQRAVAKEELGGYVAKLPFLNDTVRSVSGLRVGTLVVVAPSDQEFTAHGELHARIKSLDKVLRYTVYYGERWDGGPPTESGVAHSRLRVPASSPWLRRFEAANRECQTLVTEISLALMPRLYAAKEFIIRGGQVNDQLSLMFEGSAFRIRARASWQEDAEDTADTNNSEENELAHGGLTSGELLSSRKHDVIGVDIIQHMVGQPMPSTHHVAAIGHVFVNALNAETLERIMSQETCPKLLAATRHLAGWQLFRAGVFRVGAYAVQERKARLRYYNAAYLCQKLALKVHHREVLAKRRQSRAERDPVTLAKLTRPCKPLLWRRARVKDEDILTKRPEASEFHAGQKVYVLLGGTRRPAEITCDLKVRTTHERRDLDIAENRDQAHAREGIRYAVKLPRTRQVVSAESVSRDLNALLKTGEVVPTKRSQMKRGELLYARFANSHLPQRARVVDMRDDGMIEVSFQNLDVVVEHAQITLRHQPGSLVTIREPGCFLERAESRATICTVCADGYYSCLYENVPATYVTSRFRKNGFNWLEVERAISQITTAWRKMVSLDVHREKREITGETGGGVLERVRRLEAASKETQGKLDLLLAHLKVPTNNS